MLKLKTIFCYGLLAASLTFIVIFSPLSLEARTKRYGETLCDHPDYHCIKIQVRTVEKKIKTRKGVRTVKRRRTDTWQSLFPDERERDLVRRINRMNIRLRKGMIIAVPNDMEGKTYMDFAPYPKRFWNDGEKEIYMGKNAAEISKVGTQFCGKRPLMLR